MIFILIFLLSLVLTIFSLPYVIRLLTKLDIVDKPDSRKLHTVPIPRMGGIVIFAVTFITLFSFIGDFNKIKLILVSTSLLLVCGMIDDKKNLSWKKKFVIQFAAAAAAVFFLSPMLNTISFFTLAVAAPWSYILLTFFIVGAVNSVNLLDGMDGLVSGYSLIIFFMIFCLAYITHNYFLAVMCATLAGSTLGFLKFNAFPAKVFLGDTGSLVLGMFIVFAGLLITPHFNEGGKISLTFPIILLGLPIVDTVKVMFVRILNRKSPFLPDRNHVHHLLVSRNIKHQYVVFILQIISIVFVIVAYYYMAGSKVFALIIFTLLAAAIVFMKPFLLRVSLRNSLKVLIDRMPAAYLSLYKKFLMPLSIFTSALLVTFLIPGHSGIPVPTNLILIGLCSVLFFLSHYQFIRTGIFNETYVLVNLLIFSAVASISSPLINLFAYMPEVSRFVLRFSNFFLIFFIVFFLLTRERLFAKYPSLFSGMDLVVLAMILLISIVHNFVKISGFDYLGMHLAFGFGIYLWYKIMLRWKVNFGVYLFYFSFILPVAAFTFSILV